MQIHRGPLRAFVSGCAAALIAALAAACSSAEGGGTEYRPHDRTIRLDAVALDGDDIGMVRDFDIIGDSVYLLDALGRIAIVERRDSGLALVGQIGRPGGGPGELQRPNSLAAAGGNLVVFDGPRLQFFSRSGEFLTTKPVALPCAMQLPAIAPARNGLFLHGTCLHRGMVTDTVVAVLAWTPDTVSWEVIIQAPVYAADGSMGSVFSASNLLTTGPDGHHAFGAGVANCIWDVDDTGERPTATESCPAASALYRADPPPELKQRMRSGKLAGMNIEWPETLPVYGDRFVGGNGIVLLRAFRIDSLVLQMAAPVSADIAVAPFDRLLGCRAAGCVWLMDGDEKPRLIVLDRARLESLIAESSK